MNEHHNYKLTDFIFTFITFIADFRLVSIICQSLSHSFPLSGDRELTTAGNVKACFHRRNFPKELGTLGSVCFHRRNQDLNKVPGKNLPLTACEVVFFSKVMNFRGWDLDAEHADWLSSRSIVFQPLFIHIIFKILWLLCHEM